MHFLTLLVFYLLHVDDTNSIFLKVILCQLYEGCVCVSVLLGFSFFFFGLTQLSFKASAGLKVEEK